MFLFRDERMRNRFRVNGLDQTKIDFTDENDKYADWIPKIVTDRRRLRITDYLDKCDGVLDEDSGKNSDKN